MKLMTCIVAARSTLLSRSVTLVAMSALPLTLLLLSGLLLTVAPRSFIKLTAADPVTTPPDL